LLVGAVPPPRRPPDGLTLLGANRYGRIQRLYGWPSASLPAEIWQAFTNQLKIST